MTKSLTSDISSSKAVRPIVVAKLIILGISFLSSFIFAFWESLVAKLVILGISFLI